MYRFRPRGKAWGLVLATVFVLALGVTVAGARPPLIAAKVPPNQTIGQLISGKFVEKLRCTQSCRATTNLLLSGKVAKRLGFKGAKPKEAYGIALITTRLARGKWSTIRLTRARGEEAPRQEQDKVPLNAVVYARTTADKPLKGAAAWHMTLRR